MDMTQLSRTNKMALSSVIYRLYISCCLIVIKSNFDTYAALPKISKSSTILLRKLNSSVEACFNVTGIPKPLLKISKQDNNIVTTSANRKEKYCVYFDLQDVNTENITVTAENCFGNSTIIIDIPNFQSKFLHKDLT